MSKNKKFEINPDESFLDEAMGMVIYTEILISIFILITIFFASLLKF